MIQESRLVLEYIVYSTAPLPTYTVKYTGQLKPSWQVVLSLH